VSALARPLDPHVVWRLALAGMRRRSSDRALGVLWWLLDPLLLLGVYALVFGNLLGLGRHPEQQAYPLFVACALVPWRWFTLASTQGGAAFTTHTAVLSSIPIDRESVLLSEWIAATGQSLPGLLVLLGAMAVYGLPITANLLLVLPALIVQGLLGLGVAYALCPLSVMIPDVGNLYAALLRVLWFLSPGLYALDRVPTSLRSLYVALNPLAGVFEGIRRPIHAGAPPDWTALAWSAAWAVLLLVAGRALFRRLAGDAVRML
jgi:ABC-type polysaccharide/polyol phosphate export permease